MNLSESRAGSWMVWLVTQGADLDLVFPRIGELDFEPAFDVGGRCYADFGQGDNGVGQRSDLRISPPPSVSEAWTVPLNEILPLPCAHTEVAP